MDKISSLIAKHEGLSLEPYKDSIGIWTVGYGHNCQDKSISKDLAERLLQADINDAIQDCQTFDWFSGLDEVREAVIINMVFNLGLSRFSGFFNTIRFISLGEYYMASVEMKDSKWYRQVGNRAVELCSMMKTGEWQ